MHLIAQACRAERVQVQHAGRYDCRISRSWKESLSLYTVAEAKTGERKSSVFDLLVSPIRAYEAERLETELVEADVQRSRRRTMEQKLELARKAAAEGSGAMEEVESLRYCLRRLQPAARLSRTLEQLEKLRYIRLRREMTGGAPRQVVELNPRSPDFCGQ